MPPRAWVPIPGDADADADVISLAQGRRVDEKVAHTSL